MRSSAEHEHEDYEEGEHALGRVHDDAHPHALPPPRGVGGDDDVGQGSGDRLRLVQVVEGQEHPVGDEVALPKTPRIRGSRNPRKSRSSPRNETKTSWTTSTANQPQFPLKNSWPPAVPKNRAKSWLAGPVMSKPKNSHRPKRRTKGITHNQTLPPPRGRSPGRGAEGATGRRARARSAAPPARAGRGSWSGRTARRAQR